MRIIAGALKGRQFASPRGHRTHPMSDKMRGALFNALGDIGGLTILDAFAGSGALGFEAVSRGAAQATAIERDRHALQAIESNILNLGLKKEIKLVKAPANSWLSTTDRQFDVILCDPPYDSPQIMLLKKLAERAKPAGITVFSLPPGLEFQPGGNFEQVLSKNYGDSQLVFYRRLK